MTDGLINTFNKCINMKWGQRSKTRTIPPFKYTPLALTTYTHTPQLSCPNPASGGEKKPASTKHQSPAPHRSTVTAASRLHVKKKKQQLYGDPAARHIRNEASRASVHLSPAVLHPGPAAPEQGHGPPQQRPSIIG
ncbi:hypothetical protein F7725_024772 [Dissostichus mawsoni]|uniref:Uncharacterized protein n=1 Tax=Dissostichus mawsoni TaxID=36200 RepID=A0A7J5XAY2_DISMA|nr:hypothetical protein F7725_024772 [Dissostichus mawsoni]